ncbi:MAG: SH3 domain-containing protein [Chloroflexi bacterium]|nr:SH3 domain-containing protein [Chloroflexota bacterium]
MVFTATPSPAPQIQVGSVVEVVSEGGANIRNAPGTGNAVVTVARENQQFNVIGGPELANDLTWWQLRSPDGSITGWAAENDGTNDLIAAVSP